VLLCTTHALPPLCEQQPSIGRAPAKAVARPSRLPPQVQRGLVACGARVEVVLRIGVGLGVAYGACHEVPAWASVALTSNTEAPILPLSKSGMKRMGASAPRRCKQTPHLPRGPRAAALRGSPRMRHGGEVGVFLC
jgi:hypothetical protein